MALSVGFTQNQIRQFQDGVLGFLLAPKTLYNFFEANKIKRRINPGDDRYTYLRAEEIDGGMLTSSMHKHNTVAVRWTEVSTGLDYLVTRLIVSRQDRNRFSGMGNFSRGNLVQETLQQVIPKMMNQMDQLLAWGDEFLDDVELDVFADTGEITGIFNGGTAYGAGLDNDNDMQQVDDYLDTVAGMIQALKTAHHHLDKHIIWSDLNTERFAKNENQFYQNVGISEHQRIIEQETIKDWITSENFTNDAAASRMAILAPNQKNKPVGAKGPNGNFELVMGYDFDVHFDANGGTIGNYVIGYVTCSFKLVEKRVTAIQRTGDLTLT